VTNANSTIEGLAADRGRRAREHACAAALFLIVAVVMTWPLAVHPGSLAVDQGDPLLNAWIMAWDAHRITSGSLHGFFDANIFFPYRQALDFSEHLVPQALVGLLPLELSGNPLLAYSLVWLLAMAGSAFGMYVLARRLTASFAASVFAGIAFGFSLFMMSQLPHLQVLSAAGLPLSFYFLDRFCAGERLRNAVWLGLTIALQMLANGYYAVMLPLFIGIPLTHHAIARRRWRDRRFLARIALLAVVIAVVAGPFLYQYASFRATAGFTRGVVADARLWSYLSAPPINHLWGHLTAGLWRSERMYFPGLVTLALGVVGIVAARRRLAAGLPPRSDAAAARRAIPVSWVFKAAATLLGLAVFVVLAFGYFRSRIEIKAHDVNNPLLALLALVLLWAIVEPAFLLRLRQVLARPQEPLLIYGTMMTVAVLLSVGALGPFLLLNRHLPGFDAIRAFPRVHVFFMLGLVVFAAFGFAHLEAKLPARRRRGFAIGACLLLLGELACMPLPLEHVKPLAQRSEVYRWLARQPGDDWGLVELPFPRGASDLGREIQRVYDSTIHWKRIMNGYSGYFPPMFDELTNRWNPVPLAADIEELRGMGLRFVVVHGGEMSAAQLAGTQRALAAVRPPARAAAEFGNELVYELPGWCPWPPAPPAAVRMVAVGRDDVVAGASVNDDLAKLALDGKLTTRWYSGPQIAGEYFQLDFGAIRRIRGLSMLLGESRWDAPRGYRVDASLDGEHWTRLAERQEPNASLHAFLDPKRLGLDVSFPPVECRYLRITDLASDPTHYWSICEITAWQ
jgi:hypothetical protein